MRNLLPLLFILACPIMMIFMMRGMHGSGGSKMANSDPQRGHEQAAAGELRAPDERITQLEHEIAQLRALQSREADHNRASGP